MEKDKDQVNKQILKVLLILENLKMILSMGKALKF